MSMDYGKKYYDSIEIPEELQAMVQETIRAHEEGMRLAEEAETAKAKRSVWRRYAAAAVIVLLISTIGVSVDPVLADGLRKVPVIGELIQTLTKRSFHGVKGEIIIDMEVPLLESESDLPERISREIHRFTDEYMQLVGEEYIFYRQAFFMTGGTMEQWEEHENIVVIDYNVTYCDENVLSLVFYTSKTWGVASENYYYYNIDLSNDELLTLEDMLGGNYAEICDTAIRRQIEERLAADDTLTYYGFGGADSFSGFTGVTAETEFYLNEKGEVVVVYPAYAIAPGFMGVQEFIIAYKN